MKNLYPQRQNGTSISNPTKQGLFMPSIDIIIVVRAREEIDVAERIRTRKHYTLPIGMNFIVVDDGSHTGAAHEITEACREIGAKHIRLETEGQMFNLSRGRNAGIRASEAEYVLFEDVDLFYAEDFYLDLQHEVRSLLCTEKWQFLVFPVIYLSETGTNYALENRKLHLKELISEITDHESSQVESFAPVSSLIACSTSYCRSIGGFDEAFEGWGFEDSDFVLRMLRNSSLEKPRDFYKLDTRNYSDQVQWRGWRAFFRLHGDLMAMKGMYGFHAWHPAAQHKSDQIRERNRNTFLENTKFYAKPDFVPQPLLNPNKPKQLFLSRNPHAWGVQQFSVFDNPIFIDETTISMDGMSKIISKHNIECVVLPNPYGTEHRLNLYRTLREQGVQCIVVERGALPGSIYFDPDGFCAESTSYAIEKWNVPMSPKDLSETREYVQNLILSGASLEPQGNLIGGSALRCKLSNGDKQKKFIFVAFQSPSDTTTNYFCGETRSYGAFIHEMKTLATILPKDWKMLYKNHPLSKETISIPDGICVDSHHIGDILETADACCLLNSGVGVLSICYGKPVFHFGQTFYNTEGMTYPSVTAVDVVEQIYAGLSFDRDLSYRFIKYLIKDFYSFANWTRKERDHTAVAKMSISVDIQYKVIRCIGRPTMIFNASSKIKLRNSILFDRYRLDDYIERKNIKSPPQKPAPAKPAPAKPVAAKPAPKAPNGQTPEPKLPEKILNKEQTELRSMAQPNPTQRKLRKLIRNPGLFFKDALIKRVVN